MASTKPAALVVAVLLVALTISAASILAQPNSKSAVQPPSTGEVQRLHGIIDKDQTWEGSVLITDDLTIQDATVTVNPGTTVEFALAEPGRHPMMTVGTAVSATGELRVLGSADQPVTFRTREGTNAGRLVINVRSKLLVQEPRSLGMLASSQPQAARTKATTQPAVVPSNVTWRHVRFENLGYAKVRHATELKTHIDEPALVFNVIGGPHTLQVSDCSFKGCCRLEVRAADGAKVTVADNQFSGEKEKTALEVFSDEGVKRAESLVVTGNLASAVISVNGAADVGENILIGPSAAIVVRASLALGSPVGFVAGGSTSLVQESFPAPAETKIRGNYIHNTTAEDDGHYCLNCEDPGALIDGNILRGGTACVLNGSKRMNGNVFIAAAHLNSKYVKNAHTHQLVGALPAGATFERNLLLGPGYSMLVPQPAALAKNAEPAQSPIIVRRNLFDGFSESNRAIHLNTPGRSSAPVAVLNNIFLRVTTLVYDEGKTENTLTFEDYNAIAPPPARPFDQVEIAGVKMGGAGWGAKDVRLPDVASMRLVALPKDPPGDFDADISAKKVSVSQLRRRLFDTYRPQAGSPLVRAGRGDSESEEASGPRPTIGPSEPADKE